MAKIVNKTLCDSQEGLTVISDSVIEIVMTNLPYQVDLEHYRGDRFSFSIIGRNVDDTPFNFQDIFESGRTDYKVHRMANKAHAQFGSENHVLGQTEEAIDFDIAEGNPAQTTMDELHIIDPTGTLLDLLFRELEYDTQILTSADEPRTPISGRMYLKQDVTITKEE